MHTKNVIRLIPVVLSDLWKDSSFRKVDFSASSKCLRIRTQDSYANSEMTVCQLGCANKYATHHNDYQRSKYNMRIWMTTMELFFKLLRYSWAPKDREGDRVLYSYYTLCTIRTVHCDQKCGNRLGVHTFKINFEIRIIWISKNQNCNKNHNALRIIALLIKFKTNACRWS
jgi:hypothetical protein